jgi:phosphorylated CTD-interacting factor 1
MYKEPNLVADLVRAAHNQEAAEKIALALSKESQKSVNLLFKLDDSKLDQRKLVVRKNKHNMDFHFNSEAAAKRTVQGKKKNKSRTDLFVKLNHGHYDKLLALWKTTSKENGLKRTERRFHNDVFTLLQRYKTVQGHGFQMACGDDVFKKLAELFGVSFECFASPLNCFYPDYCSAFPDVDCAFGSRGSFFNFHPTQGSFHANPPFISDIMDAMVTHILTLIQQADKAGKPMSFVVVIPVWLEDRAYQRMVNSRYMDDGKRQKRGPLLISRKDHGYCDGAQHQRRDRTRESTFDTAMFFLRNKAGKAKWPRNKVTDTALLEAFALSKPTPAQVMRRKLAGRGLADADGGGGVFKGKKENQKKFKQRVPFQHVEKKRKTGEETTNETAAPVVAE